MDVTHHTQATSELKGIRDNLAALGALTAACWLFSQRGEHRTVTEAEVKHHTLMSETKARQHPFQVYLVNLTEQSLLMRMCHSPKLG